MTLPGVINTTVPTLVGRFESVWTSHIHLEHSSANHFTATALQARPKGGDYAYILTPRSSVEFVVEDNVVLGFACTGFWGAGAGVGPPKGRTPEERAEVWFHRLD